jgi:hypothetical protein
VTVPFTVTDVTSGVSPNSPASPVVVSAEGNAVSGSVTVTDVAGNSATFTTNSFKIDKTAPTISWGAALPAANSAGWNNTNVSVAYTPSDTLSGLAPNSPASPLVVSTEGTGVTGTVILTDLAGNSATFTSAPFNIDKTPPSVTINQAAGQADPTSNPTINFTVLFSEKVTDFVFTDVDLSKSTTGGNLTCTVSNSSGDQKTFNVAVTGMAGGGTVVASVTAGVVHDVASNINAASTSTDNSVTYAPLPAAQVVGRDVFYNNSKWDSHTGFTSGDPAANQWDDAAIATDKSALLPGQTATFANYTNYLKGLNGIIDDISGLNGYVPTAGDFQFLVGNTNTPSSWGAAPTPTAILDRPGAGVGGSDRIDITWADNAIQNKWLQVTVLAANLGLTANDVFCFGNQIGDTGNSPTDTSAVQAHYSGFSSVSVTNPYDINRDKSVDALDFSAVQAHYTGFGSSLILLSMPVTPKNQTLVAAASPAVALSAMAAPAATPSATTMSTTAVDAVHAQPAAASAPQAASKVTTALPTSTSSSTGGTSSSAVVQAKAISDDQIGIRSPLGTVLEEHLLLNLLAKARH